MPSELQYPLSMRADMVSAHYAGYSNIEIAKLLGVSSTTINNWMYVEKRKFPKRRKSRRTYSSGKPNRHMPWEIIEAVLSCIGAGFTQAEASRLTGVNQTTVSTIARRAKENKIGGQRINAHSKAVHQQAAALARNGLSASDAAKFLRISVHKAREYALAAGIDNAYPQAGGPAIPTIPVIYA